MALLALLIPMKLLKLGLFIISWARPEIVFSLWIPKGVVTDWLCGVLPLPWVNTFSTVIEPNFLNSHQIPLSIFIFCKTLSSEEGCKSSGTSVPSHLSSNVYPAGPVLFDINLEDRFFERGPNATLPPVAPTTYSANGGGSPNPTPTPTATPTATPTPTPFPTPTPVPTPVPTPTPPVFDENQFRQALIPLTQEFWLRAPLENEFAEWVRQGRLGKKIETIRSELDVSHRTFVIRSYLTELKRPVAGIQSDFAGVEYWTNQLVNGSITREHMVNHLRQSTERFLRDLYVTTLRRTADEPGLKDNIQAIDSGRMTRDSMKSYFEYVCANKLNGECR